MKKYQCAVIGCGRIGCSFDDKSSGMIKTHASSYYKNSNSDLISLCDIDIKKLKKYSKKFLIDSTYSNYEQMFLEQKLDIILR